MLLGRLSYWPQTQVKAGILLFSWSIFLLFTSLTSGLYGIQQQDENISFQAWSIICIPLHKNQTQIFKLLLPHYHNTRGSVRTIFCLVKVIFTSAKELVSVLRSADNRSRLSKLYGRGILQVARTSWGLKLTPEYENENMLICINCVDQLYSVSVIQLQVFVNL